MCVLVRGVPRPLWSRLGNPRSTGEHLAFGDPPSYEQRFGMLVSSTPFFYIQKADYNRLILSFNKQFLSHLFYDTWIVF